MPGRLLILYQPSARRHSCDVLYTGRGSAWAKRLLPLPTFRTLSSAVRALPSSEVLFPSPYTMTVSTEEVALSYLFFNANDAMLYKGTYLSYLLGRISMM